MLGCELQALMLFIWRSCYLWIRTCVFAKSQVLQFLIKRQLCANTHKNKDFYIALLIPFLSGVVFCFATFLCFYNGFIFFILIWLLVQLRHISLLNGFCKLFSLAVTLVTSHPFTKILVESCQQAKETSHSACFCHT